MLPLILGFTAGLMAQSIHLAVDTFNDRPQTQLLWFVAALITAMSSMALSGQSKAQSPESKVILAPTLDSGLSQERSDGSSALPRRGH